MTWGETKTLIAEAPGFDGDSSKSLIERAIGTATDTRLQLLLRNFSAETFFRYTRAAAITFIDGDWENVDLVGSRCAQSMSKIMRLSIGGIMIGKVDSIGLMEGRSQGGTVNSTTGIPTKGTPICWAESDLGVITFDIPIDMTTAKPAWCSGWIRHPVIANDDETCQIDETYLFAFVKYAAISLKENVSTSQGAMERLKRFDVQAFNMIKGMRAENMARWARGMYGPTDCGVYP